MQRSLDVADSTVSGSTKPPRSPIAAYAHSPLPRMVGRYEIIAWLGGGGMGEVWVGHDTRLQRPVAIKRLRGDRPLTEERRLRLANEAQLNARLSHPNVVQVYDFVTADGVDHIVTEYIEGRSLDGLVSAGPPPLRRALAILIDVCRGLGAAHRHGIVHRDLKLENVLIGADDSAKIADFGIATLHDSEGAASTGGAFPGGTIRAMSPEQSLGLDTDARSDLFSLGVLAYELTAGISPFAHADPESTLERIRSHPHRPLLEVTPTVPVELSRLVDRLLQKAPELRPAEASEVEAELERALRRLPPALAPGEREARHRIHAAIVSVHLRVGEAELEAAADQLFGWHRRVRAQVARHEGHVIAALGEEVLVCVGFPRSHASNCEVAAELVAALATDPIAHAGTSMRAAIDVGSVVVLQDAEQTFVVGPPVAEAASLGRGAADGEVLATARAHGVLSRSYRLSLRSEPGELAYRIEDPLDWEAHATDGELVGRTEELELLHVAETRAFATGQGDAIALVGLPGIGKSALVRTASARSNARRRLVVRARERTQLSAFEPFRALLRRLPALRGSGDIDRDSIARCVAELPPAHPDRIAVVATVCGVQNDDDERRLAVAAARQRHTFLAEQLAAFLLDLLAPEPTLLVVEDLHWLDSSSLDVVRALSSGGRRHPMLVVVTSRPHGVLDSLGSIHRHELASLHATDAARIIDAARRGASLSPAVGRAILDKAAGVPLLLEELTHFVVDRAAAAGPDATIDLEQIPTTLRDSVLARLQDLAPATRHVAELAASMGVQVDAELLLRAAGLAPEALETHMRVLGREGLLLPMPFAEGRVYAFRHALTRDVVYEGQGPARRIDNHRAILAQIDAGFPSWRHERPELVAVQHAGAGEHRHAAVCWAAAGRRATAAWSPSVARDHFEAALAAIERSGSEEWVAAAELEVRRAYSPVLAMFGWGSPQANANTARIRDLTITEQSLDWTTVYLRCLNAYVTGRTTDLSAELGWLAREAEGGDVPAERGLERYLLWSVRGMVSVHAGYLERARAELGRALALREGLLPILRGFPLPEPMIIPRAYLAWVELLQGDAAAAWDHQRAAEESFEAGTREHVAACSFGVPVALVAHDFDAARRRAELVVAADGEPSQHTHLASMALGILELHDTHRMGSLDELEATIARTKQGFEAWRTGGMRTGALLFTAVRAEACLARARHEPGTAVGERAVAHARELIGEMLALVAEHNELDRYYASEAYRLHAECLVLEGQLDAAVAAREEARWRAAALEGRGDRPLLLRARIPAEACA